jgi:AbrB family looped-hinge helix DNA binding protein
MYLLDIWPAMSPITLTRKLVKIGDSLRVTVPPEIIAILKIKKGEMLEFAANDGEIIIRKARG